MRINWKFRPGSMENGANLSHLLLFAPKDVILQTIATHCVPVRYESSPVSAAHLGSSQKLVKLALFGSMDIRRKYLRVSH